MYLLPSLNTFRRYFKYVSAQFSPMTWINSWVIDPQVPELCSFFLCVLVFSLSFRLGSFYLSVFWVTAFFCLHHSAGFCVLVIVFFSSEISFWLFFISLLSTPPPFFLNQDTTVVRKKVPATHPTSSWHHADEDVGMLGYILVREDVLSIHGLCWHW